MISSKQTILKPHDLVIALKVWLNREMPMTYASLANDLFLSASEVHSGVKRAQLARLVAPSKEQIFAPIPQALREFAIHGAKYAFPAVSGPITRGVPTAQFVSPLKEALTGTDETPLVWPFSEGSVRGPSLVPLYSKAPQAALLDQRLHEVLALLDALRIGAARERELAEEMLSTRLS